MTLTTNGAKKKTGPSNPQTRAHLIIAAFSLASAIVIYRPPGFEQLIGVFFLAMVLMSIVFRDILRYQPGYVRKKRMLVLLGLMMVFSLAMCRAAEFALGAFTRGMGIDVGSTLLYGLPAAAGPMLIVLLFDFHTAIITSFMLSLLLGLWQGDASFTIYAFVGSLTAAFSIVRCKRRTAILRSGMFVFGANLLTVLTIMMYKGMLLSMDSLYSFAFATSSAVFVVAAVSLVLPLLENVFKVSTDISLLELLDLDHPLMRNMMVSAPGTYHHSIIVGNLVEACSEHVRVNPLLARVGAYYHDIGKAKMPEYFIENSPMGVSKHEHLTPHMSSMVLISHVKEGVELARGHKLPEEVIDIIQQHHGNALITFFYEKARGMQQNGEAPSEDVYRYPGPKPQSRVAALIMMADAVEAASRVLTDPTPARISALVEKIVNHIFLTGQLEECELTFKDIHNIKSRFIYILTGILHKRIDYPGFDFNGKEKAGAAKVPQPAAER